MINTITNFSIVVREGRVFAERCMKDYSLMYSDQIILMYLSAFEETNQDTISSYFHVDKGSIAKTIAKLEKKQYIKKQQDNQNHRQNIISLTEEGISIVEKMNEYLCDWKKKLFSGMTDDEIALLEKLSAKLVDNAIM